jgi:hypothetical protein
MTGVEDNPTVTTASGIYGTANPFEHRLIVQGDIEEGATITFYVNGVSTGQTAEWHSGDTTELDLAVTIPRPPSGVGGGGGPGDSIPPIISDVLLCPDRVTETTSDICWQTQEKSDSQVEYWSNGHKFSVLDEEMVINHQVQLTGLTPGTTYHYKVMSRDEAGNLGVSDEYTFTTLGKAPVAAFTCSDLSISPNEVNIGETVTISMLVTNTGNAAGGYEVTLNINGVVEATEELTLKASASEVCVFTITKDIAGTYSVNINGLSGSFQVREKPPQPTTAPAPLAPPPTPPAPLPEVQAPMNWPLIGGIMAGVVVVGLLIFFRVRRRAY